MGEVVKSGVMVPESVLKKQKRAEEWSLAKAKELEEAKNKKSVTRKLICQQAKKYAEEYENQVLGYFCFKSWNKYPIMILIGHVSFLVQDKELIRLKREARMKGGFYVDPEAKLLFIVRIRG